MESFLGLLESVLGLGCSAAGVASRTEEAAVRRSGIDDACELSCIFIAGGADRLCVSFEGDAEGGHEGGGGGGKVTAGPSLGRGACFGM